jgi:hypothetical protein
MLTNPPQPFLHRNAGVGFGLVSGIHRSADYLLINGTQGLGMEMYDWRRLSFNFHGSLCTTASEARRYDDQDTETARNSLQDPNHGFWVKKQSVRLQT